MIILASFAVLLIISLIYSYRFWGNLFTGSSRNEMVSLVTSINSLVKKGYTDDFQVTDEGLKSLKTDKLYKPDEIKIVDFHRFEGTSDPGDESILYAIETNDGDKGTLVDAFGTYSETNVDAFIKKVEEITKKPVR
ncbi:MAG TPA: hypothetical protein VK590_01115 [Saprospiraceae bacterium]|nr:hypothetical protein [Saprospiraceae bacterium]